jgi:PKD repeat protein
MNGAGDIALGYSVSSTSVFPSIRFTGRLAGDQPGLMTVDEGEIIAGGGYQNHSSGRWGDYSMLAVDPNDDCTFWYTQEYYADIGTAPWHTRIASFQLSACGTAVDSPPTVSVTNPTDGEAVTGTITITADASDDNGVDQVEFFADSVSIGVDFNGLDGWSADWDSTSVGDGSHTLSATATDTAGKTASDSVNFSVDNINDPPVASFTYACAGLTCTFDASGSNDPDGSITGYAWTFGDGSSGTGVGPAHDYTGGGTYTVTLAVTDDDGAADESSQGITVNETSTVVVSSITPNSTQAGASVNVTISGSGFQSGTIVTFENGTGPAPSAMVISVSVDGTQIAATVSTKAGGPPRQRVWDVRVTNPDGSTDALPGGFTITS